jgi:hypothetical protein
VYEEAINDRLFNFQIQSWSESMSARYKDFVGVDFHAALAAVRGGGPAAAYQGKPTPAELHAVYARGFQGIQPDRPPEVKRRFGEMMQAMPALYDAFPWAKGLGDGKVNCPYIACLMFMPEWGGDDAQERGDCTVHGTAHAGAIDYCLDAAFGETKFMGPLACENIYRSRGYNGDGWSCEEPCLYVGPEGKGGFLYRQVWKDPAGSQSVDLSRYNSSWEGNGSAGTPSWMEALSQQNKVKYVIPIKTAEEYRDCLAAGFGINVCSGQGFSDSTDEWGVARAQGSWSHSMAHTACIATAAAKQKYGDQIGGIQQSWGKNWNTQSGKPEGSPQMAGGMFYSRMNTVMSMVSGEDSFGLCGLKGWQREAWQRFDIADYKQDLMAHLKDSAVQDRYEARAKWLQEQIQKSIDMKFVEFIGA